MLLDRVPKRDYLLEILKLQIAGQKELNWNTANRYELYSIFNGVIIID